MRSRGSTKYRLNRHVKSSLSILQNYHQYLESGNEHWNFMNIKQDLHQNWEKDAFMDTCLLMEIFVSQLKNYQPVWDDACETNVIIEKTFIVEFVPK